MVKNMARIEDLTASRDSEIQNMISKALKSLERSNEAFEKAVSAGLSLTGTGSGKIPLLLPATDASQNTM